MFLLYITTDAVWNSLSSIKKATKFSTLLLTNLWKIYFSHTVLLVLNDHLITLSSVDENCSQLILLCIAAF